MVLAVLMERQENLGVAMVEAAEVEELLLAWVQEEREECQEVAEEAVGEVRRR